MCQVENHRIISDCTIGDQQYRADRTLCEALGSCWFALQNFCQRRMKICSTICMKLIDPLVRRFYIDWIRGLWILGKLDVFICKCDQFECVVWREQHERIFQRRLCNLKVFPLHRSRTIQQIHRFSRQFLLALPRRRRVNNNHHMFAISISTNGCVCRSRPEPNNDVSIA